MNTVWTIAKRELKAYFVSPIAYITLITFLALTHWLFLRGFFLMNEASLRSFFQLLPWIYLFFIPAIAMGKWAEEKKMGTIELLFTLPLSKREIVLGKFLAGFFFIGIALGLTFSLPITVVLLGAVDYGPILGGYLGLLFLGGAYLSIGLWISSLTDNQIVAFILGVVVCFAFFIIGEPIATTGFSPGFVSLLQYLSLGSHFESIGRGVLDSRDLLYYFSIILLFLFLTLKGWNQRTAILTMLIGLAALNLLAARHSVRFDLTKQKVFTLSPATREILKGLEDVVTLRLYFSEDLPPALVALRRNVEDILSEFKTFSRDTIHLEYHNPQENPVEEQKVQMMGIPPVEVNVIKKDKQEVAKIYLGMAVQFGATQEILPFIQSTGNFEYQLAAAILKITQIKKPELGWWGEEGFSRILEYLKDRFVIQQIMEEKLDLLDAKKIPALLMAVPETLSEASRTALKNYLETGGKAIFLIDRFDIQMTGMIQPTPRENPLEELLKNFGVTVENNLVLDQSSAMATFTGGAISYHLPYPFWVQIRPEGFDTETPFVAELNSLVLPWASSLKVDEKLPEGVTTKILFQTSPTAVRRSNLDPNSSLLPESTREAFAEEKQGTYSLGLLLTKKNSGESEGAESKLILIGNSRFLQDNFLERFQENVVFVENAIDIFTTGDQLISIRSKGGAFAPMAIVSDAARETIKIIAIAAGPFLLGLFGFGITLRRKAAWKKLKEIYA